MQPIEIPSEKMSAEEVKNHLFTSGCWPFIKQRPYDVIANPNQAPKSIFVSAYASSPLAADYDYTLAGKEKELQAALTAVSKLTAGKVHVSIGKNSNSPFSGLNNIELHEVSGPHPVGNVSTQIAQIDPINNYNIIPYIGDYVNWKETYKGLKGNLDLSYYVLREDSAKAVAQFKEVPKMLEAFEYWMGPYPFYEDGFKLVQSPHLGMEHQSAVAYGNKFKNGYLGTDLSKSGWGLKWDYIIIHESGHEWFANNISTKDIADMWVHEGFTSYSETLYTEYFHGKKAGDEYNFGLRKNISNDIPVIGKYGMNQEGSGDMYPKGANLLHTIRHAINNDSLFRNILMGLNSQFYHQTVTTEQVENYISLRANFGFQKVFDQYLRTTQIPVFSYSYNVKEKILTYQFKNCVTGFNLPLHFNYLGKKYSFMPMDYQPQQRLIQDPNFNLQDFVKTIESQYYLRFEQVN